MSTQPGTLIDPVARNRAVLGKGVHIGALMRLHELYPDVRVEVEHRTEAGALIEPIRMDAMRREEIRITRVTLRFGDGPSDYLWAEATCHPEDRYERRVGIAIAFRRALDAARTRSQREAYTAAWEHVTRTGHAPQAAGT